MLVNRKFMPLSISFVNKHLVTERACQVCILSNDLLCRDVFMERQNLPWSKWKLNLLHLMWIIRWRFLWSVKSSWHWTQSLNIPAWMIANLTVSLPFDLRVNSCFLNSNDLSNFNEWILHWSVQSWQGNSRHLRLQSVFWFLQILQEHPNRHICRSKV